MYSGTQCLPSTRVHKHVPFVTVHGTVYSGTRQTDTSKKQDSQLAKDSSMTLLPLYNHRRESRQTNGAFRAFFPLPGDHHDHSGNGVRFKYDVVIKLVGRN